MSPALISQRTEKLYTACFNKLFTKSFGIGRGQYFFALIVGGTLVVRLKLPSKILIPYGDLDRPDKLRNLLLTGRLDGHQNFPE